MPSYLRENITKRKDNENKGEQIRERGWYEKGNGNNVNMENIKERFTENAPIQEWETVHCFHHKLSDIKLFNHPNTIFNLIR